LEKALEADPRDREAQKARKDLAATLALEGGGHGSSDHSRQRMVNSEEVMAQERVRRLHRTPEDLEAELERLEGRYAENPSDVDLLVAMGEVHELRRDPEAALDLYRRALSYRKDSAELASKVMGMTLKAKKRALAQAGKAGDQALADRLEAELADLERQSLEQVLQANPQAVAERLELGRILARVGDLDAAIGHLQRVAQDPRFGDEARFFLALCFYRKGLLDLAKDSFQTCLPTSGPIDGRACEILYHLGLIAEQQGDAQAARAHFSRIYAVDIAYRDVAEKMEQL
ncbi:MAG TPA: tetratricopeptide repeat protein, partial [Planctomycetota bacterium]|nr:tetratricopeptide repeat protein [Planctomycetota bacterium]